MICVVDGGDRSQEWAVRAAMWAQQRLIQEQYQQQNPIQQLQPPLPSSQVHPHPPLPPEAAPPPQPEASPPSRPASYQPLQPETNQVPHGFIHEERMRQLQRLDDDSGTHSPWSGSGDEHHAHGQTSLQSTFSNEANLRHDSYGADKAQWKPFGEEPAFRNSPGGL